MSVATSAEHWMGIIRKEYLQDFIRSGGAAVKFLVPLEGLSHSKLISLLRETSEEEDYLFVSVDASKTRIHMIDKIFHTVSRQVDWGGVALAFLCSVLSQSNFKLPESREDFSLSQLADLNGEDPGEMRREVSELLGKRISRDFSMTHELRIAARRLCAAQLEPQSIEQGVVEAVKRWLNGDLPFIAALKPALIFRRIGRHNGRQMLSSLTHWLHLSGKAGLVLVLDISRFLEARRVPDDSVYYSGAALLDGYEVLRQFIDSTDELRFCLILVLAPLSLVTDERRGIPRYEALRLRVWDEVQDKRVANPLSSLVRLSGQEPPGTLQAYGGVR